MINYIADIRGTHKWSSPVIDYTFEKSFYDSNSQLKKDTATLISNVLKGNLPVGITALNIWAAISPFKFNPVAPDSAKLAILSANVTGSFTGWTQFYFSGANLTSATSFIEANRPKQDYIHEIGHALGLDHPGHTPSGTNPNYNWETTIMSYNSGGLIGYNVASPMIYDIAAIQAMYGANRSDIKNTTYNAANALYPVNGSKIAMTIWDAGGTDTLDASKVTGNHVIDLRGGLDKNGKVYFSKIGDERIAIALDPTTQSKVVDIENGVGGAGNDTIYGGYVGNNLKGNGGTDKIYGGLGADTLYGGDANDTISGGFDNDKIYGEAGNDLLTDKWFKEYGAITGKETATAVSTIYGGLNDDTIIGGRKVGGKYYGDDGNDTLIMLNSTGKQTVDGGIGNNTIWTTKNTTVIDAAGNDTIWGNGVTFKATDGVDQDVFIAHSGKNVINTTDNDLIFIFDPENKATTTMEVRGDYSPDRILKIGDTPIQGTFYLNYEYPDVGVGFDLGGGWHGSMWGGSDGMAIYTIDRAVIKYDEFGFPCVYIVNPQIWLHGAENGDFGVNFVREWGQGSSLPAQGAVTYTEPDISYFTSLVA